MKRELQKWFFFVQLGIDVQNTHIFPPVRFSPLLRDPAVPGGAARKPVPPAAVDQPGAVRDRQEAGQGRRRRGERRWRPHGQPQGGGTGRSASGRRRHVQPGPLPLGRRRGRGTPGGRILQRRRRRTSGGRRKVPPRLPGGGKRLGGLGVPEGGHAVPLGAGEFI